MPLTIVFWVLMIVWFVFGILTWGGTIHGPYVVGGGSLLIFVLFAILGFQVFGPPIRRG